MIYVLHFSLKQEPAGSDSDISPPRIKQEPDDDLSPPRKLMKTTLDGKKAGLQDARSMKVENEERRKKESKMLDGVSPIYLMPLKWLFTLS